MLELGRVIRLCGISKLHMYIINLVITLTNGINSLMKSDKDVRHLIPQRRLRLSEPYSYSLVVFKTRWTTNLISGIRKSWTSSEVHLEITWKHLMQLFRKLEDSWKAWVSMLQKMLHSLLQRYKRWRDKFNSGKMKLRSISLALSCLLLRDISSLMNGWV